MYEVIQPLKNDNLDHNFFHQNYCKEKWVSHAKFVS